MPSGKRASACSASHVSVQVEKPACSVRKVLLTLRHGVVMLRLARQTWIATSSMLTAKWDMEGCPMTGWTAVFAAPYAPFYIMLLNIGASLMTHAVSSSTSACLYSKFEQSAVFFIIVALISWCIPCWYKVCPCEGQRSIMVLILSALWLPPIGSYLTHCLFLPLVTALAVN